MTLQEMLTKIPQLTARERLVLLDAVSRSLSEVLDTHDMRGSAERLLGIIKTDQELTDEDIERIRFEHLMEKHS
jgi:hypothetical protein